MSNYVIGITGGSAAGKGEFLKKVLDAFTEEEVCLLSQDNYYRPNNQQRPDESGYVNFDLPETIDEDEFSLHLQDLKFDKPVQYQIYDFEIEDRTGPVITLNPAPIIMVEGIFVFHYPKIAHLLDLKLYVEADSHLMLKRRILRDQNERGYGMDEILYRFEKHVIPAYEKYIQPYKKTADIVIPNYDRFDEAFEVVASFIRTKLP